MLSACGRYVIVFNGEVYNFRALRAELEAGGHRFRGHSDTEVMLAAIAEWGLDGGDPRFIGMFAFALWDRAGANAAPGARPPRGSSRSTTAGRRGTLLFASELKAIRAHPAFTPRIDRDALAAYIRHNYIPAPHSIYKGFSSSACGVSTSWPSTGMA